MLFVPLALFPVFWAVVCGEVSYTVTELVGLEEQELDEETRDVGIVPPPNSEETATKQEET